MDDQLALFRTFLVKDARLRARWVLDAAAGNTADHVKIVAEAAIAKHLEFVIAELDLLVRDAPGFTEKHNFRAPKEPA